MLNSRRAQTAGEYCSGQNNWPRRRTILRAALIFFIIAIIAAVFGFTQIAAGAAAIAQVLFYIFVVLFLIALIAGLLSGRRPPIPPVM